MGSYKNSCSLHQVKIYQVERAMYNMRIRLFYENVALEFRKYFVFFTKFLGVFFVLTNHNLFNTFYKVTLFILTRYLSVILFFYLIFDYFILRSELGLLKLLTALAIPIFLYFIAIPTKLNYFLCVLVVLFEFYIIL